MINAKNKSNENCSFVIVFLKYNHHQIRKPKLPYALSWEKSSDYIALCEGDDCWTNKKKLQLQIDFLDNHLDYSMCFGDAIFHHVDGSKKDEHCNDYHRRQNKSLNKSKEKSFYSIICSKCRIQTLTAVVRSNLFLDRERDSHNFMMGDTPLWLDMSQLGKIGYIEECLGVYNIHLGSATNNILTRLRFTLSAKEMCIFYCYKYGYKIPLQKKIEYNLAYFKMLFSMDEIKPLPMYNPFSLNYLHKCFMNNMKHKWVQRLYKTLFQMDTWFYSMFIRLRSIKFKIQNSCSH